jgi:tetratricopeptide (TPR) repeat protein
MLSFKQATLVAIFLVTASACFAQLAEKSPFSKTYDKLNTLYEEEKYEKIINLEKKILKQSVEDTIYADAMYFLADSYYFIGDLDKAIEYARQEIKINTTIRGENYSDKEVSLEWLGLTLMEAGHYAEAEEHLTSSSNLYKTSYGADSEEYVESIFNLGDVFRAANKIEIAAKLYEELLTKFPTSRFAPQAKQRLPLARKNSGS